MEHDHLNWPDDRLLARSLLVGELLDIHRSDPRHEELTKELNLIAFEIGQRLVEKDLEESDERVLSS